MKNFLKTALTETLGYANVFPTKMTETQRIRDLLPRLHPVLPCSKLIRFGPKGDGGYLVPDDLDGVDACFSPGVSLISGFEKDCADRGMQVFLADKSVSGPAENHKLFKFTRKFIGVTSNSDFMTIDEWVRDSLPVCTSELMLQIDIEGYEYEVFLSASEGLMKRFRIIVAEFHSLDLLWSESFFNIATRAFDKILQTHTCVHIHPNNCCGLIKKSGLDIPRVMEFTFLRSDRIGGVQYQTNFPSHLDFDNTDNPMLPLPRCWYRSIL